MKICTFTVCESVEMHKLLLYTLLQLMCSGFFLQNNKPMRFPDALCYIMVEELSRQSIVGVTMTTDSKGIREETFICRSSSDKDGENPGYEGKERIRRLQSSYSA